MYDVIYDIMESNIHARFRHFVETNLMQDIGEMKLFEAYREFSKLKWSDQLLENPKDIPEKAKAFLRFVELTENEAVPSFVVGRQCQLSDSIFSRCLNSYKSRYLNVKMKNKEVVDLGVLDYLNKMNTSQLLLRLPKPVPCMAMHTARLMRELWLVCREHNLPYKIRSDQKQLQDILKKWFRKNYTMKCEHGQIGYPRRQLMEEANDFLVQHFGASKLLYCHDPSWRWFMKEVIGVDDSVQKGHYLRLPVWKKDSLGNPIINVRKSIGTGGAFSFEKRHETRLQDRLPTKRERDAARKARENKKKKQKKDHS